MTSVQRQYCYGGGRGSLDRGGRDHSHGGLVRLMAHRHRFLDPFTLTAVLSLVIAAFVVIVIFG